MNSKKITTFESSKNHTKIITSNNNTFLLNDQGAFLSNLTLGGIAKGSISSSSTSAINGSQLFKEISERQNNDIQLQNNIHNEADARIDADQKTLNSANAYTDQKINTLETHYQAAVAASIAIASLPQPSQAGKKWLALA